MSDLIERLEYAASNLEDVRGDYDAVREAARQLFAVGDVAGCAEAHADDLERLARSLRDWAQIMRPAQNHQPSGLEPKAPGANAGNLSGSGTRSDPTEAQENERLRSCIAELVRHGDALASDGYHSDDCPSREGCRESCDCGVFEHFESWRLARYEVLGRGGRRLVQENTSGGSEGGLK